MGNHPRSRYIPSLYHNQLGVRNVQWQNQEILIGSENLMGKDRRAAPFFPPHTTNRKSEIGSKMGTDRMYTTGDGESPPFQIVVLDPRATNMKARNSTINLKTVSNLSTRQKLYFHSIVRANVGQQSPENTTRVCHKHKVCVGLRSKCLVPRDNMRILT